MRYIVGIDEAGRGPLAGPVAVGIVKIQTGFDKKFFKGVRDSKKLSERDRELWFARAKEVRKENKIDWSVSLVSEKVIDKKGIVFAINLGIRRCLKAVNAKDGDQVFLDGGIRAPEQFRNQQTIIKGDDKIPVISLASILAKVTRDRRMKKMSGKYPKYGFEKHKGYGTKLHVDNLRKYGSTELHRKTFIKRLTK